MKKSCSVLSVLLVVPFLLFACAGVRKPDSSSLASDPVRSLARQIDTILADSLLRQTNVGIKVVSLTSGEVLYDRNSERLFHPASNMKLLPTATALARLGPNFKFKTVLYADSSAIESDSLIAGDLYVKGFGNPDLTDDDLRWLVTRMTQKGIKRIEGDLICDASYCDDLRFGAGWMWDEPSTWFWGPISALTVNDNCIIVRVKPGREIADSLLVQLEPNTSFMKIENMGVTIDSLDSSQVVRLSVERDWKLPGDRVTVAGVQMIGAPERTYKIPVFNAPAYFGRRLVELIHEEGIEFAGTIKEEEIPNQPVEIATHFSESLTSVVMNTNKISDNLSAELLLKTMAAEATGEVGTARKGLSIVKEFLHEAGLDTTQFALADGSGASRYNVLTPNHITHLLIEMDKMFHIQAEFKASLPIAGLEHGLSHRMKNTAAQGRLRAKTGTLRGVSNLAGYTTTADGEPLAFSIMMEHFVGPTSRIRGVQDRIGALLSSFTRKKASAPSPDGT